ncbi:MAG: NAD-dependent protein deacetylase [Myxococcales bacterium]|nr:NAD-dependent protein deacetylase [Myxococcales bacterium]
MGGRPARRWPQRGLLPRRGAPGVVSVLPLARLFAHCTRLVALTGAGCSTESGIPDYRSPRDRPRSPPVQYLDFIRKPAIRQRYWARSFVGWPAIEAARPNPSHGALAALEGAGRLAGIITQNVDGLHHAAGSRAVTELHGRLAEVRCHDCGDVSPRAALQVRLAAANPGWADARGPANADGDAELGADTHDFVVPPCLACGGVLKPRVVFFGENVPPPVVAEAFARLDEADGLLVAGTSLAVYSGLRFVRAAAERGLPIGGVNLGTSRGDADLAVCVRARTGAALPALAEALGAAPSA